MVKRKSGKIIEDIVREHPVDNISWVIFDALTANSYNPNKVFKLELDLLKQSLIEDGWTSPIVIREDNEIIDGFHRWWLVKNDEKVRAITNGYVPVVYLKTTSMGHQMMSTIRHNRARGSHLVLKMASIVQELIDVQKLNIPDVMKRLGMEKEEVERLYDRGGMIERGSGDGFSFGWIPDTDKT